MSPIANPQVARAYLATLAAVLAAFGVRFAAHPVVGENHPYSLFFPVVLLCAYVFGRGPAVLGALLGAALAYWTFVEPRFGAAFRLDALAPLALFLVSCGVAIYLITSLAAALRTLALDQDGLRARADAHAALFRDLQTRIGHHMSLLMGVLTFQARGEPDPAVLLLLRRAGERSELIARAHRDLDGAGAQTIDLAAFADALARLACAETKSASVRVEVNGGPLMTPTEIATSLGVALAECLTWILRHEPQGTLRVDLQADDERVRMWVGLVGSLGEPVDVAPPAAFLFRAMVEQLGARLSVDAQGPEGAGLELTVPLPPSATRASAATLH